MDRSGAVARRRGAAPRHRLEQGRERVRVGPRAAGQHTRVPRHRILHGAAALCATASGGGSPERNSVEQAAGTGRSAEHAPSEPPHCGAAPPIDRR
uniref:Uncharacterized protein n=1 Tax=Arundo donax TaxID=35708 RepID=A0A0A9H9Y7_ARUDO